MAITDLATDAVKACVRIPRRIFGTRNERILKRYRRQVPAIGHWEDELRDRFDEQFDQQRRERRIDDLPEEERPGAIQTLRVELSEDLRRRMSDLSSRLQPEIEPLEAWWQSLQPAQRVQEYYREEYRKRNARVLEALDTAGVNQEAFAVLREASRRAQDHRHFDCQLVGGRVLYEGKIAEMRTGEGKTIVCHLAALTNYLFGRKTHIVTVNDYLVKRDAEFAAPIFELLGVTVGYIQGQVDPSGREGIRHQAYACDITYGTNSEFGFDYLRDNMKTRLEDQVQGPLDFVIVDEVDSILIDEARTPLIISGPTHDDVTRYARANAVAEELVRRQITWDRKVRSTVARFDGNTHNIPKLDDAMRILGFRGAVQVTTGATAESEDDEDREELPALGPDFLTDDQAEAIQIYENDILKIPPAERYRRYFIVQTERKQVSITHDGVTIAQEQLDLGSLYAGANMEWPHLIENALRARKVYERDKEYVVQNGQVIIVDQFTGRLMHGRQWSDGLHQAVEAKERVRVKEESQTLATITIQNFIKLYRLKAGMTGTAMTEATEFDKIYRLDMVEIPTNRPVNRLDHNDKMYRSVEHKYNAIVDEIHEIHRRGRPADPFLLADVLTRLRPILDGQPEACSRIDEALRRFENAELGDHQVITFMCETYDEAMGDLVHGRPVLVGTTNVEDSEKLSRLLERRYGIEHEVLNAKNHAREAEIVAKAGHCTRPTQGRDKTPVGNVTIATNMAGRGTDIKLGEGVVYPKCKVPENPPEGTRLSVLYPSGVTQCCVRCAEYDPATNCAHCFKPKIDPRFPALGRQVCSLNVPCGLHIIGTERHESRRIDNQLRGRSGRQGDPGSSRFSLSLEDDLLKLFMPDWMLKMMEKLGFTEGTSLEDKRLNKGIERAQRKVEERNFSTRKHLLEWDEPMDYQRKEFYTARQRILEERGLPELIFDIIDETVEAMLAEFLGGAYDRKCIAEWCSTKLDLVIEPDAVDTDDLESAQSSIRTQARDEAYDAIRTSLGEYIDPEEPPNKWDIGGLLRWAQRMFNLTLSQNQLRRMEPAEIENALFEAADAHHATIDLSPIAVYLDRHFPHRALTDWARGKFSIDLQLDDVIERSQEEIRELLSERVRAAYREREVKYPVEVCINRAVALHEQGAPDLAAASVAEWANGKYGLGWTAEHVAGMKVGEIQEQLIETNRVFLSGKLEEEIDAAIKDQDRDAAIAWARERFGPALNQRELDRVQGDVRDAIVALGYEMLRWELTRLEHYVLLRIYDQAWKDHLLEMDHLKDAIMQRPLGGDQAHPQSQYAIEGRELFQQMWTRIAGRVTDIVFKVRQTAGSADADEADVREGPAMSFVHADAGGAFAQTSRDQAAAMRAQNAEQKVETIRRDAPRVGRNEPCPCGSGKKYKQCHGRQ